MKTKESKGARGTHDLSSPKGGGSIQGGLTKQANQGHSRPVKKGRGTIRSGKEHQRVRGTHSLSSVDEGTIQDSERKPVSEGHSRTSQQSER
jgi:hypothetical protein